MSDRTAAIARTIDLLNDSKRRMEREAILLTDAMSRTIDTLRIIREEIRHLEQQVEKLKVKENADKI